MVTQFDYAYMRHPTSMSPSVQTKLDCELSDTNYFRPRLYFIATLNIVPKIHVYEGVAPGASYKANLSRINVDTIYSTVYLAYIYPNKIAN